MTELGMRATKAFTLLIALGMIIGGLGLLGCARVSEPATADANPGGAYQPSNVPYTGVTRTVLWEEFTNSKCSWCPKTEACLMPALLEYGYPLVAPVFPHTWFPAANDSISMYSIDDVFVRNNYYGGLGGVPWCACDGFHVQHEITETDVYREYFDKALGDLSRFSIRTTGNLTAETVSAVVEAHEVIPPGANLSIRFGFWEDNIDVIPRFGFKGQYFTTYHWAMWDMLPNAIGEIIFPAGANPGDKAWFNRSFFIDPGQGMIADEVGVTVWIQNDNTLAVEQAKVEDFDPDPPLPVQDIAVKGLHVNDNPCYINMTPPNRVIANKTIMVNGTVLNWGASNETNIEVNLTVNGTVEQTQYIPFLETGHGQRVTFNWTVPIMVGNCTVAVQATPVAGDVNVTNNIHEKTVWVERPLDLWVSPESFDFQVWEGQTALDNMMMGNNGLGDLDYDIDVGELTDVVGSWDLFNATIPDLSWGNIYNVTTPTFLVENKIWLEITNSTEIYHVVYEGDALVGDYSLIQENHIASSGTGEGWFSSGSMNVPLQAGKYYYIGITYIANVTLGMDDDAPPFPVSFGTLETSAIAIVAFPPTPTITNAVTNQGALKQAVVTSDGPVDWLSVSHDLGALAPESTEIVNLTVNTSTLSPGAYQSYLCIHSQDHEEPVVVVPVNLTVLDVVDTLIPVHEGWNFISLPLIPSDTTVPTVLLDQDSNTTWTILEYYDSFVAIDPWKSWMLSKPTSLNDLTDVNESMGIWLYVEAGSLGDGYINVSGVVPSSTAINLKVGWNMVGYPSLVGRQISDALAGTGYDGVEGYNATAAYRLSPLADTYMMKPGEAYWVHVPADTVWVVDW